ncbi:MAG: hypothetical protein HY965_07210 [Ignavibacteriales bacterium]|nr:hypothetical protein [Ignavibacteriales bacterium]
MRNTILLLFCLLFTGPVQAQSGNFDSLVNSGINDIYAMKHQNAESTFRTLIADYPKHPAGRFFLAMIDWWKILVDLDNESYDDIFFQKLEDVIFQCDKILDKEPQDVDALFFKGGAIGFRGRLHAIRESWLKAADDGREALPIVERAAKLSPQNNDVKLGFGIYNYYAAVIPEDFPLVKPLMVFFPKGDKQLGINQLNETAANGKYTKIEAKYFLMTLYYSYENNNNKAKEYADELYTLFPDNPVFERWRGRIAVRLGETENYVTIFTKVFDKYKKQYLGYNTKSAREACYYLGFYNKNAGIADTALYYFEQSILFSEKLQEEGGSGFLSKALLYAGMMSDVTGKRENALQHYKKVLDTKNYDNTHEMANNFINQPFKF